MSVGGWKRSREKRRYYSREDYNENELNKRSNVTSLVQEKSSIKSTLPSEYQPQFMNYQLIGDRISFMILCPEEVISDNDTIWSKNYVHSTSDSVDLLSKLKSREKSYPVAKRVILSTGYNDCIKRKLTAQELVENIREIINELRGKGCTDIVLTNVPPCACIAPIVDHWRYLQTVNSSIKYMYEKSDDVIIFNIFKLFCRPINVFEKEIYILDNGKANYKILSELYNKYTHKKNLDLITFNSVGRSLLKKYLQQFVDYRIKHYLVFDVVENFTYSGNAPGISSNQSTSSVDVIVIDDENKDIYARKCNNNDVIKIDDSESENDCDDVILISRNANKSNSNTIIVLDDIEHENDDLNIVRKRKKENHIKSTVCNVDNKSSLAQTTNVKTDKKDDHQFGCECKICKTEDRRLLLDFLTTLSSLDKDAKELKGEDTKPVLGEMNLLKNESTKMNSEIKKTENKFLDVKPEIESVIKSEIVDIKLKPEELNHLATETEDQIPKIEEIYLRITEPTTEPKIEKINPLKIEVVEESPKIEEIFLLENKPSVNMKSEIEEINQLESEPEKKPKIEIINCL